LTQGKHPTNHEYYDEFNNLVAAINDCGTMIAQHPTIYQEILGEAAVDALNPTAAEKAKAKKIGKERYLAVSFLLGADRIRYGMMIEEIENEYLRNRDESSKVGSYPLTIANAYEYLENYKKNPKNLQRLLGQVDSGSSGMAFSQTDEKEGRRAPNRPKTSTSTSKAPPNNDEQQDETTFATRGSEIICRRCGDKNHKSPECRATNEKSESYKATQGGNMEHSQFISASVHWDNIATQDNGTNFMFLQQCHDYDARF
jgi:hypothetical protein